MEAEHAAVGELDNVPTGVAVGVVRDRSACGGPACNGGSLRRDAIPWWRHPMRKLSADILPERPARIS
jgi:hypothetical protein